VRDDLEAAWNHLPPVHLGDALFDASDNLLGVAAGSHHHYSAYGFGIAAFDHRSVANFLADVHFGDIANINRRAGALFEDDVVNVVNITKDRKSTRLNSSH